MSARRANDNLGLVRKGRRARRACPTFDSHGLLAATASLFFVQCNARSTSSAGSQLHPNASVDAVDSHRDESDIALATVEAATLDESPSAGPVEESLLDLALQAALKDAAVHLSAVTRAIANVPGRFNEGNPALAQHRVSRTACEVGLKGVVVQTPEQRATCHGYANMVPIFRNGDGSTAKACIDVFEFPNRACALPAVWGTPREAEDLCESEGKRLCTQPEWTLACGGDPAGGADRLYAYGDELDLTRCNTQKPHPFGPDGETWACSARTAETAWHTCATETEPSGAFPGCRSRFGVFDLHGNVAEIMTRTGEGAVKLTQLKGSAFFYVDVYRQPNEHQKPGGRETYPDTCAYDPRWHVEHLDSSMHSNYHLGFRCCFSL